VCVCASRYAHQMSSPRASIMSTHRVRKSLFVSRRAFFSMCCDGTSYVTSCKLFRNIYLISSTLERILSLCCLFVKRFKTSFFYLQLCVLNFTNENAIFERASRNLLNFCGDRRRKMLNSELRLGVLLYVCIWDWRWVFEWEMSDEIVCMKKLVWKFCKI
jgi:hypothetical protein